MLSKEDFKSIIDAMVPVIAKLVAESAAARRKQYSKSAHLIDGNAMAAILNVTPITVWRLASRGTIPSVRVGRHFKYDRERVTAALDSI